MNSNLFCDDKGKENNISYVFSRYELLKERIVRL